MGGSGDSAGVGTWENWTGRRGREEEEWRGEYELRRRERKRGRPPVVAVVDFIRQSPEPIEPDYPETA